MKKRFLAEISAVLLIASVQPLTGAAWLALPTENTALFSGNPEDFYMFVERDFEGKKSRPWEGGMYGFTRSPQREGGKIVFTRFHEGIDIGPVRLTESGQRFAHLITFPDNLP